MNYIILLWTQYEIITYKLSWNHSLSWRFGGLLFVCFFVAFLYYVWLTVCLYVSQLPSTALSGKRRSCCSTPVTTTWLNRKSSYRPIAVNWPVKKISCKKNLKPLLKTAVISRQNFKVKFDPRALMTCNAGLIFALTPLWGVIEMRRV